MGNYNKIKSLIIKDKLGISIFQRIIKYIDKIIWY